MDHQQHRMRFPLVDRGQNPAVHIAAIACGDRQLVKRSHPAAAQCRGKVGERMRPGRGDETELTHRGWGRVGDHDRARPCAGIVAGRCSVHFDIAGDEHRHSAVECDPQQMYPPTFEAVHQGSLGCHDQLAVELHRGGVGEPSRGLGCSMLHPELIATSDEVDAALAQIDTGEP